MSMQHLLIHGVCPFSLLRMEGYLCWDTASLKCSPERVLTTRILCSLQKSFCCTIKPHFWIGCSVQHSPSAGFNINSFQKIFPTCRLPLVSNRNQSGRQDAQSLLRSTFLSVQSDVSQLSHPPSLPDLWRSPNNVRKSFPAFYQVLLTSYDLWLGTDHPLWSFCL